MHKTIEHRAKQIPALIMLSLVLLAFCSCSTIETNPALKSTSQLVVVTSPNWESVTGTMQRYERASENASWHHVGGQVPVVLGRKGLGVGRGSHPAEKLNGPVKKEGDGKAPAGIFRLRFAFGIPERETMSHLKMPYLHLSETIECIDDVNSVHYNSIVDRKKLSQSDWNSSEKMRAIGEVYRLGIFVDHNISPRKYGAGSCIFIHIWENAGKGTSGCTAMERANIEELLQWLDAKKTPTLVQLVEADYRRLRSEWNLPQLK